MKHEKKRTFDGAGIFHSPGKHERKEHLTVQAFFTHQGIQVSRYLLRAFLYLTVFQQQQYGENWWLKSRIGI